MTKRHSVLIIAIYSVLYSLGVLFYGCAGAPKKARPEIKITCRDYLLKGEAEEAGYGLYSYMLFSAKPDTEKEFRRYAMLHRAYRSLHSHTKYEDYREIGGIVKENVNITYWPLSLEVSDTLENKLEDSTTTDDFFISNYDYFRAELILGKIKGIETPGPFIIALYYPLNTNLQILARKEMLIIDLSRVGEQQFSKVLHHFKRKVLDAPETWQKKFEWELIKIHFCSALEMHGKPVLYSVEWVGEFFGVKKAFGNSQ